MIKKMTTKQLLVESMIELMQKKPFAKISVQDIVDNCGVSKRTFYNYFQDKFDLISWHLTLNQGRSTECTSELLDLYTTMKNVLNHLYSYRIFYKNAFSYEGQNDLRKALLDFAYSHTMNYFQLLTTDEKGVSSDVDFALKFYVHGSSEIIQQWVQSGMYMSVEELTEKLMQCVPCILKQYLYCED